MAADVLVRKRAGVVELTPLSVIGKRHIQPGTVIREDEWPEVGQKLLAYGLELRVTA